MYKIDKEIEDKVNRNLRGIKLEDVNIKDLVGTMWTVRIGSDHIRTEMVTGYDNDRNVYLSHRRRTPLSSLLVEFDRED